MNLAGACVLLTGASGGIGASTARALIECGARVMLAGRDAKRLDALARCLPAKPGQVTYQVADITTACGRGQLRVGAMAHRVNVLVNNAGLPCFGALGSIDDDDLERVIATNLVAPVALSRDLLPHLMRQPEAMIVNVGSTLGRLGLPGYSVYAASKFGLRGFSEALRRELSGTHVKVVYVAPRATRTAFNDERASSYNAATGTHSDEPHVVAAAIVRSMERAAPEHHIGFPERIAVWMNGLAPRLLDRAFHSHRDVVAAQAASPPAHLQPAHKE